MRLLVSVRSAEEALAALDGGADLIDAKDPRSGALGAVSVETLAAIHAAVGESRPVTAALGDAKDELEIQRRAHSFAAAGAEWVKVGFAGITNDERIRALIAATVQGATSGREGAGVVVVAYADADQVGSVRPDALLRIAEDTSASGLLIDTADKSGPGLRGLVASATLAGWVHQSHAAGRFVALAGKLQTDDLDFVRESGADIAGVRGAACEGGRNGRVVADRVRWLKERSAIPLPAV